MYYKFIKGIDPKDPSKFIAKHRPSKKFVFIEQVKNIKQKDLLSSPKLDMYSKITAHSNCANLLELRFNTETKEASFIFEHFAKDLQSCIDNGVFLKSDKPTLIKRIIHQLLKVLSEIHSFNFVYLNLNLNTVAIIGNDIVKLTDFTEACAIGTKKPQTFWSEKSIGYLSSDLKVTSKVDSYSIGCVMLDLMTKIAPQPRRMCLLTKFLSTMYKGGQQFRAERNLKFLHPYFAHFGNKNNHLSLPYLLAQLVQKYKFSIYALNLLSDLLHPNPKKRVTASQALLYPFFKPKPERYYPKRLMQKFIFANFKSNNKLKPYIFIGKYKRSKKIGKNGRPEPAKPKIVKIDFLDIRMKAVPVIIDKPKEKPSPLKTLGNRSSVNLTPVGKSTRTNSLPDTPKKSLFRGSSPDIFRVTPEKVKNPKLWKSPSKKEVFVSFRRKFEEFESKIRRNFQERSSSLSMSLDKTADKTSIKSFL